MFYFYDDVDRACDLLFNTLSMLFMLICIAFTGPFLLKALGFTPPVPFIACNPALCYGIPGEYPFWEL